MPLHDLQIALVDRIHTPSKSTIKADLSGYALSATERLWLEKLGDTKGFQVTRDVQRWWRKARLRLAIPLSLRLLSRLELDYLVEEYIDTETCNSLFFVPEAKCFQSFLSQREEGNRQLMAVAQFEAALHMANESRQVPAEIFAGPEPALEEMDYRTVMITRTAATSLVTFPVDPEKLLGALILNQPLPESGQQSYPLLIATGIDRLWRTASDAEADILRLCAPSCPLACLLDRGAPYLAAIEHLLNEGVLNTTQVLSQ